MIYPGSLIRWGALGAVVLLVRAVVREAQAQRSPVILLPPATEPGSRGQRVRERARAEEPEAVDGDSVEAPPAADEPATETKSARE